MSEWEIKSYAFTAIAVLILAWAIAAGPGDMPWWATSVVLFALGACCGGWFIIGVVERGKRTEGSAHDGR